jgi:CheY-like chemotaxis protein
MRRVLVCDSAAIVQFVLQRYLSDDEVAVDYAKTPRDLTRILENLTPDVILLEAEISGGKGRFVCDYLSRNLLTQNIPVILSTRLSVAEAKKHALNTWPGVVGLIRKPLSHEKVKATLYEALKNRELELNRKVG